MAHWLVFTAVVPEAKAISRALRRADKTGTAAEVQVIGIAARHLPAELPRACIRGIILAGFAGGLDPRLAVGDIVIDGPEAGSGIVQGLSAHHGAIHTHPHLVSSVDQKAALRRETNAVAVDMEGDLVRAFARTVHLPFLHIRVISDAAGDMLNPALLRLVDSRGRVKPIALVAGLLRRPALIPQLLKLAFNARRAARQLGVTVAQLVTSS